MKKNERVKILTIIFEVTTLLLLFVSISLMLDYIFTQNVTNNEINFSFNFPTIISIVAIILGSISWLITSLKWIQTGFLDFYLKCILLAKSILILGSVLLLIV